MPGLGGGGGCVFRGVPSPGGCLVQGGALSGMVSGGVSQHALR